jgi:hypothetical protein
MIYSDHAPILLRMALNFKKRYDFRIEHWWLSLQGFDQECNRLWALLEGLAWELRHKALCKGLSSWA